ncbi:hypothetical protein H0H92_012510 [Tricholoma furcatifolium]|nr:hypothetical protein H0H92_012510 [Tricholoma furcatifolium]
MSLVSRATTGDQALEFIFKELSYTGLSITEKIRAIHSARDDVKACVRILRLDSDDIIVEEEDSSNILCQFLRTLPNLRTLEFIQLAPLIPPNCMLQFFDTIRQAPLSELVFVSRSDSVVEGLPVEGISSLEKLSIQWRADDNPSIPGSSVDHLYHLIRPSLQTLIELELINIPETTAVDLDIRVLRDAGQTLQALSWMTLNHDDILDTIPEIFPRLIKLALKWYRNEDRHSLRWKDSHVLSLAKNTNLVELQLSSDFEADTGDTIRADRDYAWYIRCYKRRLETTRKISTAMPQLRKCNWLQLGVSSYNNSMTHRFVIEERLPSGVGDQLVHVVRGIRQMWMGSDQQDQFGGGIVRCKLEDLPGDIIDEIDPRDPLPPSKCATGRYY